MTRQPLLSGHDRTLRLDDGRVLAFSDLGEPTGYPIVFGHGMPGSRLEGQFFHERGRRHGFRIITPDRPGIGGSDYQKHRNLLDYPDDIRQLVDALGIDRFIHVGWSSGGSRTIACAYALADRMDLGVCLSGYTNFSEFPGRHSFLEGTRWPGPKLARLSPALVRLAVRIVVRLSRHHPGLYMREAESLVSEEDRRLLHHFLKGETFRKDQLVCLASGGTAIATDLLTELEDWGFRLASVQVPILIYQGEDDPFVPVDYARHLAENLPSGDLTLMPDAGHLYPLSGEFQDRLFGRLADYLINDKERRNTAT